MFASLAKTVVWGHGCVSEWSRKAAVGQMQHPHPTLGCTQGKETEWVSRDISSCLLGLSPCQVHWSIAVWPLQVLASWWRRRLPQLLISSVACCDWTNGWETGSCSLLSVHYFWWDDNYLGSCSHQSCFLLFLFENIIVHSVKYYQRVETPFFKGAFVRVLVKQKKSPWGSPQIEILRIMFCLGLSIPSYVYIS